MVKPPDNITIGVDETPPPAQLALLAVQYAFLLCVYLVLVVIVVRAAGADSETARSVISMAMIASALGTMLQALNRGPVGSGYLAPPVFSAIYLGPSILAAKAGGLPAVACMTVCAGLFEIVIGSLLHKLRIIMQPVISGLTITIIGLELGVVGLQHALDVDGQQGQLFSVHVAVALLTLSICVGFAVWGTGVLRLVCTLIGLLAGVGAAFVLGLFNPSAVESIAAAPWLQVPNPAYMAVHWDVSLMPAFLAAGLAAAIRTVGVVTTCQRANDAAWKRPDFANIRKGIYADGIGCALGGLVGAPGMNIGPSLVGVSITAGVTSRTIAYASAAVLVVLAFVPKVADVFLQLPLSVAGALLAFTASIMLVSGLGLMLARPLGTRMTFVVGLGILLPLVHLVSPHYFESIPGLRVVANSGLALGLMAAIGLLLLFRIATGRQQTIFWRQSEDAVSELASALQRNAKEWGLTKEVAARAVANTKQAIQLLKEGQLMREPVAIKAAERDETLVIELRYKGSPMFVPDLAARPEINEESTMSAGLHDIAVGVFPDRSSTSVRGGETSIRLSFDI